MTNNVNWGEVIEEANAGGGGFAPIPDGDYDLLVTEASVSLTQNQKTMYTIETTIQGGPSNSRKVWDRLVVSPENGRAMQFFFKKMAALGLPLEFFKSQPSDDQIVNALKGRSFRAKIGKGTEYGGKIPDEIKEYYPALAGGPAFAPGAPPAYVPQQAAPAPQAAPAFPPAPPAYAPQAPAAPAYAAPAAPPVYAAPPAPAPAQSPWETAAAGTPAPPTPF